MTVAAVLVAGASNALAQGTTVPIGAQPGATQTAAAVSGTGVTWSNLSNSHYDIYYVDVATSNPPVNLTNTASNENAFLEDIDGGNIVWTHTSPTAAGDIILYNLASGLATPIAASNNTLHFQHPSIGGRYVVFERITSQYDIDVYDIQLGASPGPQVTNDAAVQLHPRVSGDVIVYEDYNADPNRPAAFGYHVSTSGPPFLIAQPPAATPDIDGNRVVYVAPDAAGNDQIVLYDLGTGASAPLTRAASHKLMPRIAGSRIVWSDDRNNQGLDVYAYDLTTGTEQLIAGGAGDQFLADVDGDRVVFTSNASGAEQIFLFTFAATPPPPTLPFGCDSAKTTLVQGPTTLTKTGAKPVEAWRHFKADHKHTYYLCVENGLPSGAQRTDDVSAAADWHKVLTPKDFQPANDPPRFVAAKLHLRHPHKDDDEDCDHDHDDDREHFWIAAIFGKAPATINVSVRVAK
jgi:beta propeller repeat protein